MAWHRVPYWVISLNGTIFVLFFIRAILECSWWFWWLIFCSLGKLVRMNCLLSVHLKNWIRMCYRCNWHPIFQILTSRYRLVEVQNPLLFSCLNAGSVFPDNLKSWEPALGKISRLSGQCVQILVSWWDSMSTWCVHQFRCCARQNTEGLSKSTVLCTCVEIWLSAHLEKYDFIADR